jgi:hypothetical protein
MKIPSDDPTKDNYMSFRVATLNLEQTHKTCEKTPKKIVKKFDKLRPEIFTSKEITKQNTSDLSSDAKTPTTAPTNQVPSSTVKPASSNPNLKPATTGNAAMSKKEQPEPPAFEKGIIDNLTVQFGDKVKVVYIKPLRIKIAVNSHDVVEIATFIRDKLGFDHAESVGGTDYPKDNQIEVIYHLGSYSRQELEGHIFYDLTCS